MSKTCLTCVHFMVASEKGGDRRFAFNRCSLTLRRVNALMAGCVLHCSGQDQVNLAQAQDEKWRPGASLPLAVPQ